MGTTSKRFQDLNLSNYFLFAAAAEDEGTSQLLLETLLGIKISGVKVSVEHPLLYSSDFRSVRLDVYVRDTVEVHYNMEMENRGRTSLPQRSRYHQAEMDVVSLAPGEDLSKLKPVYVVFICTFDPFGEGLYRYTFTNRCEEKDFFPLGDGATRVFLSTKGTNEAEVPKELVNLLHYVENSTDAYVSEVDDPTVRKLHERIRELKRSREMEARYMQFEEMLREREREGLEQGRSEGLEQGRAEGIQAGEERILALIAAMAAAGEAEQIPRLGGDPAFLEEMFAKYWTQL